MYISTSHHGSLPASLFLPSPSMAPLQSLYTFPQGQLRVGRSSSVHQVLWLCCQHLQEAPVLLPCQVCLHTVELPSQLVASKLPVQAKLLPQAALLPPLPAQARSLPPRSQVWSPLCRFKCHSTVQYSIVQCRDDTETDSELSDSGPLTRTGSAHSSRKALYTAELFSNSLTPAHRYFLAHYTLQNILHSTHYTIQIKLHKFYITHFILHTTHYALYITH